MIKSTISFSLTHRWMVIVFSLGILAAGAFAFIQLQIEAYPDIADTNVVIITKYNGRAAEEVEQKITIPIEKALNNVPKVTSRRSRTIFGLSVVQLNFQDGVDDYFARQQVFQQLKNANIPNDATPVLGPLTSAIGEIYRYVIEAPSSYTPMDIRELQDWVIIPKLLQTPGVADIATFGGPVKQFHILTSPINLRKYGLRITDIIDAVTRNNQNTGGGIIVRGSQGFAVRGIGIILDISDIENIVLTTNDAGIPIFIKDVGTVEINPPPAQGVLGYTKISENQDIDNGTEGIVLMRRKENPSTVLQALKDKIADLEENDLPKDVKLTVIYDRSFLVDHSLETVGHTLVEGILIAVLIIFLFLGSMRSALVVALTIPFALLFAFLMMWLTNIPANLLSLGAIDFGIIVDGAGYMAENIIRRLKQATPQEKKKGFLFICIEGALEVGKEIFFCVIIIVLAYLPIFTMQRVEGKLFSPMALTLAYALLGSMICALTLTPVLIYYAYSHLIDQPIQPLPTKKKFQFDPLLPLQKAYASLLRYLLPKSKWVLGGFAALLVALGLQSATLGTEFLPNLDEGSIWMRCILPAGTNIQETTRFAPNVRNIISTFGPVEKVLTQSGRNDDGTDPIPSNRIEILIVLKEYSLWADTLPKQDLVKKIQAKLEEDLPGVTVSFGQPIIDQVMEIVTGSAAHLAVSVIGDDLILLRTKADSILTIVSKMKGASGFNIEQEGRQDQILVEIDRQKAARYGINVSEIQEMIEAAIGGKPIDVVYNGPRRYDIVVRYYPEERNTLASIEDLQVFAANGSLIPMRDLAKVRYEEGQTNIYRLDGKRMITVRTNIIDRDQGGFVSELIKKVKNSITLPEGYHIIYGGQFENLERASKQLAIALPMTIIIVFVVLFALFRKLNDTLIVFACVPMSIVGGAMALVLRGYNFNISSGVGFISLFGISVMAGIMSLSFINNAIDKLSNRKLKLLGFRLSRYEIKHEVIKVSEEQLRPIMMVMIVAMLALVPAATSTGIGSDVQRPLATVIIGGLVMNLLLTPFIIPLLYWVVKVKKS
jgi:heavy metal efflux system protein